LAYHPEHRQKFLLAILSILLTIVVMMALTMIVIRILIVMTRIVAETRFVDFAAMVLPSLGSNAGMATRLYNVCQAKPAIGTLANATTPPIVATE
jgi:hypothetical protein